MNTLEAHRFAQANPEAARQGKETMQALLSRSATDLTFRQRLLDDPRTAIAEFTGQDVPETLNVVFIENHADATIVLPDPIDTQAELTEEELEAVAGGELAFAAGVAAGVVVGGALLAGAIWIGSKIK